MSPANRVAFGPIAEEASRAYKRCVDSTDHQDLEIRHQAAYAIQRLTGELARLQELVSNQAYGTPRHGEPL